MAIETNDPAAAFQQARAMRDRLIDELALLRARLDDAVRCGDAEQKGLLERQLAELSDRVLAAKVLAKRSHVAQLEAELGGLHDDYDAAIRECALHKAAYGVAHARFEHSRARLVRASTQLSSRERELLDRGRELMALIASERPPDPERQLETNV